MLEVPKLEIVRLDLVDAHVSDYLRERLSFARAGELGRALLPLWPAMQDSLAGELVAASKSDYLENKVLDHCLGKTSFTMPSTVALALCTVVPDDAKTGATITEAGYTGYARKAVAASDLNAAASGQSMNANALTFAACTASSSTIIGWALCDSSSTGAGNMLYWGTCTSTVISTTQTPATIAIGGLVVNED